MSSRDIPSRIPETPSSPSTLSIQHTPSSTTLSPPPTTSRTHLSPSPSPPPQHPPLPQPLHPQPPHLPSLPPELWIRILSHHTDLSHLWTTCRRVSRDFLAYAEQVFAEYHLRRDVVVTFCLERHNLGGKGKGVGMGKGMEVRTGYLRVGEEDDGIVGGGGGDGGGTGRGIEGRRRRMVWFSDTRSDEDITDWTDREKSFHNHKKRSKGGYPYPSSWRSRSERPNKTKNGPPTFSEAMARWKSNIATLRPEMPNYTIQIGDMVNDTCLPSLIFCAEERAVAFDWRAMFAHFFREVEKRRDLERQYEADLIAKCARLNIPCPVPSIPIRKAILENRQHFTKTIRRARLREAYAHDEEKMWALDSMAFYEQSRGADGRVVKALSEIPGAGLGERWFGSVNLLQEMFLDEWSCLNRIERRLEEVGEERRG